MKAPHLIEDVLITSLPVNTQPLPRHVQAQETHPLSGLNLHFWNSCKC